MLVPRETFVSRGRAAQSGRPFSNATINNMNAAKAEAALNGMTNIAKKVYEATPAAEPWTVAQIRTEVMRLHGTAPEMNIAEGCLNSLIAAGLVREQGRRQYVRTAVRPRVVVAKVTTPGSDTGAKPQDQSPVPVDHVVIRQTLGGEKVGEVARSAPAANATFSDVMANPRAVEPIVAIDVLSQAVRSIAGDVKQVIRAAMDAQTRLELIAEALDDVALGVTESMEKNTEEVEQLRQLRALLKNIA